MNEVLATPAASVNQPLLFQRLRWRLLGNAAREVLGGSSLRLITIVLLSLVVWGVVFAGGWYGFDLLQNENRHHRFPLLAEIIGLLFDILFWTLGLMLVFSGSIILYSSLFASAETAFLLGTPADSDQVFAYKYQGAIAFSSWAFVLVGSPVLIAYGIAFQVPWYFYALLPFYFLGFVLLPGSLGALLCLLVVNFVPRRRRQVLVIAILLVFLALFLWGLHLFRVAQAQVWTRDAGRQILDQFTFARGILIPSHWISLGLLGAGRGDLAEAAYRLALVWSNGLFFYVLIAWAARRLYRRGYNRLATGGALRRRYGGIWLDQALAGLVAFLDGQTRLLIIKDFRTFRRDPAQWAQVVIFTGLMNLYFANLHWFYQEGFGRQYRNAASLINLAATAMLLCAYTGRFIYPMLSLEGRKFWILGLLPLRRERLLWGKFAFSATWALLIAELLVPFSDLMLGMPGPIIGVHALTMAVVALGLSGLSVGMGACLPNFRESDPSKIAVGFGGTLNLIAGLLFLLVVIVLMAAPWHLWVAASDFIDLSWTALGWLGTGLAAGVAVGVGAVWLSLRLGNQALRRMEF